jgi:hypothetical protein
VSLNVPFAQVLTVPDEEMPGTVGVSSFAEIWRGDFTHGQLIATAFSGGLYGIDQDSDQSYINEVANDELDDLLTILTDLGIDAETARSAVDAARP